MKLLLSILSLVASIAYANSSEAQVLKSAYFLDQSGAQASQVSLTKASPTANFRIAFGSLNIRSVQLIMRTVTYDCIEFPKPDGSFGADCDSVAWVEKYDIDARGDKSSGSNWTAKRVVDARSSIFTIAVDLSEHLHLFRKFPFIRVDILSYETESGGKTEKVSNQGYYDIFSTVTAPLTLK